MIEPGPRPHATSACDGHSHKPTIRQLATRKRMLERMAHSAGIGWWSLVLPTRRWVWSDGMHRLHGTEPGAHPVPAGSGAILARVSAGERVRLAAALASLDQSGTPSDDKLLIDYWVALAGPDSRRIRLHGQLDQAPDGGRSAWLGVAQDVTEAYVSARALNAREAAEDALARWGGFTPSMKGLIRRLAPALDSPLAMAWIRNPAGRLEVCARWSAPGVPASLGEPTPEAPSSLPGGHHRPIARAVWATREPVSTPHGIGVPAIWRGETVAALTFDSAAIGFVDDRMMSALRSIGRALGLRLAGARAGSERSLLSPREREVLQLAADGFTGPAIAERLFLSPTTVKTHFLHIYEKLGVNERAAAVARAMRHGLID